MTFEEWQSLSETEKKEKVGEVLAQLRMVRHRSFWIILTAISVIFIEIYFTALLWNSGSPVLIFFIGITIFWTIRGVFYTQTFFRACELKKYLEPYAAGRKS